MTFLVTHAVAKEEAGASHALLPQALQPCLGFVVSVLLAGSPRQDRLRLLHLTVQRFEALLSVCDIVDSLAAGLGSF